MAEKIVYLIDSFTGPYAGTERQLWYLLQGLDRKRYEPELVLLRHTDFSRGQSEWPCPVRVLGIEKLASFGGILRVYGFVRYLRQREAKILQVFFADSSVLGAVVAKLAGVKLVAARRDMGIWYSPTVLGILRLFSRAVDKVITNSSAVKSLVVRKERIPADRVHVIHNGLEMPISAVCGERLAPAECRASPDKMECPVIGIVANFRPVKRIDDLLRAFRQVRNRIRSARLIIVGEGELEPELRVLARELGVENVVYFTGRLENPSSMIERFDIAVLCSESEGLSNALMEYLRAGKPVVCTNVGGNPELVEEGRNGFLVPVGDVDILAESITRIASDMRLYEAMSEYAKRSVEHCSIEAMLAEYMKVYADMNGTKLSLSDTSAMR